MSIWTWRPSTGCSTSGAVWAVRPATSPTATALRSPGSTSPWNASRSLGPLTRRARLDGRVSFRQGSATDLPFPDTSFDRAYLIHVGMNVSDKAVLFAEVHRVLAGGGLLLVYDVLRARPGALTFPLPWASDPRSGFVADAAEYRGRIDYLAAACLVLGPSLLLAGLTLGRSGWTQPAVLVLPRHRACCDPGKHRSSSAVRCPCWSVSPSPSIFAPPRVSPLDRPRPWRRDQPGRTRRRPGWRAGSWVAARRMGMGWPTPERTRTRFSSAHLHRALQRRPQSPRSRRRATSAR